MRLPTDDVGSGAGKTPVLYIAGEGRSGSTLLSAILSENSRICCVGEMQSVWRAVTTNELCSCGEPFHVCGFWKAVGDTAFGGWGNLDVSRVAALDRALTRQRHIARLLLPPVRRRYKGDIEAYTAILRSLYSAIKIVARCDAIVDSSKGMPYALVLRQARCLDLCLVHLVRDSRGVAFSWAKRDVAQPQYVLHPESARKLMPTRGPWRAAARWVIVNLAFEAFGRSGVPHVRVRYESLAADPLPSVSRILKLVAAHGHQKVAEAAPVTRQGVASCSSERSTRHTLGGNPMGFDRGPIQIRSDDEWRKQMPNSARRIVGAVTFPLLVAYGYVPSRGSRTSVTEL